MKSNLGEPVAAVLPLYKLLRKSLGFPDSVLHENLEYLLELERLHTHLVERLRGKERSRIKHARKREGCFHDFFLPELQNFGSVERTEVFFDLAHEFVVVFSAGVCEKAFPVETWIFFAQVINR